MRSCHWVGSVCRVSYSAMQGNTGEGGTQVLLLKCPVSSPHMQGIGDGRTGVASMCRVSASHMQGVDEKEAGVACMGPVCLLSYARYR